MSTPSFIVYKASAGSGKTFTLAVQYIKLLITNKPQEYQHTLAVTFTNKATAEMKERILEQLYGISKSLKTSEGYIKALEDELKKEGIKLTREEIRKRCQWALHEIIHDYSRFRVETIDSFFQSVLRNLARELELSANMQVDLNDKEVLNQAVDNMVDDLGRKDGDVLPWINNYIQERIENGDRWDVRDDIKNFAKCIFSENFMRRDEQMLQRLTSKDHLNEFRKEMKLLKDKVLNEIKAALEKVEQQIALSGLVLKADISHGDYIDSFLNKIRNFEDMARDIKVGKNGKIFWTDSLEKMANDPGKHMKNKSASALAAAEQLYPALQQLNELAEKSMQQYLTIKLSLKHINPLRLLSHIDKEVTEITSESNRFILAKTPILLSRLIKGTDAPFVFEKMGTLFHNVMIDEFQDTSRLQWENFKVLLLENQSQGGRDLLVGDIKQSIYRWRNGDWRILANIESEMASHKPNMRNLDANFRSEYNIIDFNNKFFPIAADMLDKNTSEVQIRDGIYKDVRQECKKKTEKGWVRVALYEGKTDTKGKNKGDSKEWEERMLNDLTDQVKALHGKGIPYEEMCILQRDRNNVDDLIAHFKNALPEAPLISDEAFKLESSKALSMIVTALKVVCNREKDPVSTRLLIQYYLTYVCKEDASISSYTLCAPEEILPEEFLNRMDNLATYPLQELCEELSRILEINKIEGEDSYLLCFYDELQAYLQNAPGDIASFLEFWEDEMKEKAIPACKVKGISIITIHKSKGLQYHTVLMPYCNFKFEKFKDDLLWCEPKEEPFNSMEVLPIQTGKSMRYSLFAEEMNTEALQKNIEELNALYVAFTRAEKNLLIWTVKGKEKTAGDVINETVRKVEGLDVEEDEKCTIYTQGEPDYELKEEEEDHTNRLKPCYELQPITMCSHHRHNDFKQSTEGLLFIEELDEEVDQEKLRTVDGLTYAQQGSLLHEIFSKIERAEQLPEVIQAYVDNGVLTNGKQVERISKLIANALEKKEVKNWFNGTYTIQNECEIAYVNKESRKTEVLRPDRVMMNDEEIIVVDFKFGKPHPEAYQKQVKGYMELLQQMYPDHKISGYLWYVYRNKIEEVKGS